MIKEAYDVGEALNEGYVRLMDGPVLDAMGWLIHELNIARSQMSTEQWKSQAVAHRNHKVINLLQEDPYTARARSKPRGYAGDAVMLDYVYGIRPVETDTSEFGRALFSFTTTVPIAKSVTERMRRIGRHLSDLAGKHPESRIVSIACGHMRELHVAGIDRMALFSEIVALDQDGTSLSEVVKYRLPNLRTANCPISRVGDVKENLGSADLIYAAGLFDYLEFKLAKWLTGKLVDNLAPGGELIIANLTPGQPETAYMEFVTDWWMHYRTASDMLALVDRKNLHTTVVRAVLDETGRMSYLHVIKAH